MKKAPAIGIDLGTTQCCVAVCLNGEVQIIPNDGSNTAPSCVSFTNKGRLFGEKAKSQGAISPEKTIYDVKRLIGRSFNDPKVKSNVKHWPFSVIEVDGNPQIQVKQKKKVTTFTPTEISGIFLEMMKDVAEKFLKEKVKNAVVTVPAYFNDAQRRATMDACKIAGLNVLRILNEPTAAAVAFTSKNEKCMTKRIFVFDLGGGTFDVSVLSILGNEIKVLAINGDNYLGGRDFDNRLVKRCMSQLKKIHGPTICDDKCVKIRLENACEKAKILLSTAEEACVNIYNIKNEHDFKFKITRDEFEKLNADLFNSTTKIVKACLQSASVTKDQIDEVILVGGSTRIPMIQNLIKKIFTGKALNKSIHPDEAVALGAAIIAANMDAEQSQVVPWVQIRSDVTPFSLGTYTLDKDMDVIIPRNSTIPISETKEYCTVRPFQTAVLVRVYEGESDETDENSLLGELFFKKIPPSLFPMVVKITYSIDINGILTASVLEPITNNSKKMEISYARGHLTKEEIEEIVNKQNKYRDQEALEEIITKLKNDLVEYCSQTKHEIKYGKHTAIESIKKSIILQECNDAIEWIDENPDLSKKAYRMKMNDIKNIIEALLE